MKLFITGTDTDIGKTYISVGLLKYFNRQGLSTLGIKPLATGAKFYHQQLMNDDAIALQHASTIKLNYETINPIAFEPAIAPHIAAKHAEYSLGVNLLLEKCRMAFECSAEVCIVEGVGGWRAPLNDKETMADFVKQSQLHVLLVVGIRLGCLNHAILTYEAIKRDGVTMLGWIANCIDPNMLAIQENIDTLKKWLPIPCWAVVNYTAEL